MAFIGLDTLACSPPWHQKHDICLKNGALPLLCGLEGLGEYTVGMPRYTDSCAGSMS